MFATHNQLHTYDFSGVVDLLSNSPGIALHLWCEALKYESCVTRITIKELKD